MLIGHIRIDLKHFLDYFTLWNHLGAVKERRWNTVRERRRRTDGRPHAERDDALGTNQTSSL